MLWIAALKKDSGNAALEKRLADLTAQQQVLIFQIQKLRRARDLLLQRLLSGPVNLKEN